MLSINQNVRLTQHHLNKTSKITDSYGFFDLLTSDELFETTESLLPDHRERLFPPTETLSMFLAQVMRPDGSCQKNNRGQAPIVANFLQPESIITTDF